MTRLASLSSLAPAVFLVATACSGSADAPAAPTDSGATTDSGVTDAVADSPMTPDSGAVGACAVSFSGDRTIPPTNAVDRCGHDVVAQQNGKGEYTLTLAGTIALTGGGSIGVACTLGSETPPAAGAVWTLTTGSGGGCDVNEVVGTNASIWSASTTSKDGTAIVTFVSATRTASTYNPSNVYYTYEATLDATLKGRTGGTNTITATGHFANDKLPLGI